MSLGIDEPLHHVDMDGVRCLRYDSKWSVHAWLAKRYHLDTFVEAGSNLGDSALASLRWAKRAYTCELSEEYHAHCRRRFADEPRIELAWGEAAPWLSGMMPRLEDPARALIYLDTHAEPDSTAEELRRLGYHWHRLRTSVVVIDDMRWDLPKQPVIMTTDWPMHVLTYENDQAYLTPIGG